MNKAALVTLEHALIIVRLHPAPAKWGEFKPYDDGFLLVQVAPNVYEAKLAKDLDFKISHRRELKRQMLALGAEEVFLWRHKEGEEPYKIVITRTKRKRENAQKRGEISGDLSDLNHEVKG